MLRSVSSFLTCTIPLVVGLVIAPGPAAAEAKFGEPEFECVSSKQRAAAEYCHSALQTWATWELGQNDARRDSQLSKAGGKLSDKFDEAETRSARGGVDCVEQTAAAAELEASIGQAVSDLVQAVNTGLDLGDREDARCGASLVRAAAAKCHELLKAESGHTKLAPDGGSAARRDTEQERASEKFSAAWERAACSTDASESDIESRIDAISDATVFSTVVSPVLDDTEFQPISPVGPIEYEGATLNPRCGFDDDPDYHFFVKRGSVNKVVVYYQGGGACWENLTCSIPVCKDGSDPVGDDPDNASSGFADLENPANPFRDWNIVFATYCTCDVHFGDADQVYSGPFPDVSVSHRGFQNARVVEKFAREHFLNPDVVFVTGSSAGASGAVFPGPFLHAAWPASRFHVLGDAGNGVITADFLQNEFENWNFSANIPADIPGVLESITSGEGMVGYIEAVANYYDGSNWAHYTSSYDGGSGGQTGFYHVMLNDSNPIAALTWWGGSCSFNEVMVDQATETFSRVPANYRYYIGAGSRHTMYGNNKVYSDQSGGESQTIVDWINDMISYDPALSSADDWQNVECTDCGLVVPGDPTPPVIPTDPFFDDGGQTVIMCPVP
jgi:hypothetical protein